MEHAFSSPPSPDSEDNSKQRRLHLTQQVVIMIDTMIGDGTLSPGQRLVESELAEQLGVSRIPVREALRVLAGDGVVELVPNSSARVRRMSPHQIGEVQRVLKGLLFVAFEDIRKQPNLPEVIEALGNRAKLIERARKQRDGRRIVQEMANFQLDATRASGNSYLVEMVRRARFGYHEAQVLGTVASEYLIQLSANFPKVVRYLSLGKLEKARALVTIQMDLMHEALSIHSSPPPPSPPN
ncbi:MAG: GntR family transcriptional regulator [Sphingobium sp.]